MGIKITVTVVDESREECAYALIRFASDLLNDAMTKKSTSGFKSGNGTVEWKIEEVKP